MTTTYDRDFEIAMEMAEEVSKAIDHAEDVLDEYGIHDTIGRIDHQEMLDMFEAYRYDVDLEIAALCSICKSLLHELVNASDGYDRAERKAYWLARFAGVEALEGACDDVR